MIETPQIQQLGFGLGLRFKHLTQILGKETKAEWFEALTENYLGIPGLGAGNSLKNLEKVRAQYPVVMHGVSLSLGGTEKFNPVYLKKTKELFSQIQPQWVSDHICWTGVHGFTSHDLFPLPYTEETLEHLASRIHFVQETWQRPLVLENVSSYIRFPQDEMTEPDFLNSLCAKTGCHLLLDVNNIYVSSRNHQFDPLDFLKSLPRENIQQIHLAGHSDLGDYIIDTHDAPIRTEVWDLYRKTLIWLGRPCPTMIERDANIPELAELEEEMLTAKRIDHEVFAKNSGIIFQTPF